MELSSKEAMEIIAFAAGLYNRTSEKLLRKTITSFPQPLQNYQHVTCILEDDTGLRTEYLFFLHSP